MHHFEAMKSSNVHFTFFRMGKILEGLLAGSVEAEVPHGVECLRDAKHIWERFGGVIDQLKHGSFNSMLHAIEDMGHVIHDIANELEECKATVGTDLDKLREMSKAFTDPWYFIFHVEHDLIVNGQDIHHEIMDAEAQWENQHFYEFGHSVGLSLSKIFLGGQMKNGIPAHYTSTAHHQAPVHHAVAPHHAYNDSIHHVPVVHETIVTPVVHHAPVVHETIHTPVVHETVVHTPVIHETAHHEYRTEYPVHHRDLDEYRTHGEYHHDVRDVEHAHADKHHSTTHSYTTHEPDHHEYKLHQYETHEPVHHEYTTEVPIHHEYTTYKPVHHEYTTYKPEHHEYTTDKTVHHQHVDEYTVHEPEVVHDITTTTTEHVHEEPDSHHVSAEPIHVAGHHQAYVHEPALHHGKYSEYSHVAPVLTHESVEHAYSPELAHSYYGEHQTAHHVVEEPYRHERGYSSYEYAPEHSTYSHYYQ